MVDRLASLAHIKLNRRDTFSETYACAGIDRHMRLDDEMVAFLEKYTETLEKHTHTGYAPLILSALGMPGNDGKWLWR